MELAPWIPNTETSMQHRTITMTLALNHAMGPKTAQVSEHQVCVQNSHGLNCFREYILCCNRSCSKLKFGNIN